MSYNSVFRSGLPSSSRLAPSLRFEDVAERLRTSGRALLLCGALPQPAALMRRAEFHRIVGADNICPDIQRALVRAAEIARSPAA